MHSRFHRLLVSTGLAAATLLAAAPGAFAQRTERRGPPDRLPTITLEVGPREAPPPLREERREARRDGHVWVSGRWDWKRREHKWEWVAGHWERERTGKRWRDARWDRRGDEWVLIDGEWIDGSVTVSRYPTAAPPPLRDERPAPRTGYVWARGKWAWQNGEWQWTAGHWERQRPTQRWAEGRWELRGDHWEWIEGGWAEIPKYPPRDQPPPPPQREDIRADVGFVVLPGRWAWVDGRYVWQRGQRSRVQPGMHYEPGLWIERDGHWIWTNGSWVRDTEGTRSPPLIPEARPAPRPAAPISAPPPPRDERVEARAGFVWARGHHEWRGGQYEWVPGHWERQRERRRWSDGRWEQRGNVWLYVEGGWN
jgi:hypothetical protein